MAEKKLGYGAGRKKLLPVQTNGISQYFSLVPESHGATRRKFAAPRRASSDTARHAAADVAMAHETSDPELTAKAASQPTVASDTGDQVETLCMRQSSCH